MINKKIILRGGITLLLFLGVFSYVITAFTANTLAPNSIVSDGAETLDAGATSTFQIAPSLTSGQLLIGGTAQSGTLTVGSSSAANTENIGVGSGALTLNVGTGNGNNTIAVGSTAGASALALQAGTGNATLTASSTGAITIGGSAQSGNLTIGSSSLAQTVQIGNGTGASTVQIAGGSTQGNTVTIAGDSTGDGNTDVVNIAPGNISGSGVKQVNILTGLPSTPGANKLMVGRTVVSSLVTMKATVTDYSDWNFIASEFGSSNAIAGQLSDSVGNFIGLNQGLRVCVLLSNSLQAGANTLTLNFGAAKNIKSHFNPANNIATAYVAGGIWCGIYDGIEWLDLSE